ncbi:MAG: hypothetical protein P1V20_28335 [Verrucomicrobiales bacterium]|nr:hypothetical protein [Verrucomicrobiales bacterium]
MSVFTSEQWKAIRKELNHNPEDYGVPRRVYGSAVVGSFNIRKLGSVTKRNRNTWHFLADMCRHFDLLAIQEVMNDTGGLRHLVSLMGDQFDLIVSDTTGAFPDKKGLDERLAYIYNRNLFQLRGVITDVTWDRTQVLQTLVENFPAFAQAIQPVAGKKGVSAGEIRKIKMPTFLAFIRTPFAAEFEVFGHPRAERFPFMAINAHLNFGKFISDREQEFDALLKWMIGKVREEETVHARNILLLGDLNLNYDSPERDHPVLVEKLRALNNKVGRKVNVCAPFLDPHPQSMQLMAKTGGAFRTNARLSETFDQIAILSRDERLGSLSTNQMGRDPRGPDFGVIDFVNLFAKAVMGKASADSLSKEEKKEFFKKFEHKVSDHMPLWFRFRLPDEPEGQVSLAP